MDETPSCPHCGAVHPAVPAGDTCPTGCAPLTPEHGAPRRPTTILWIDDDRLLLSACVEPFERHGYRIRSASDGVTGIDLARRERPDLILLDVVMFGMDGLEVCRRLRAEAALAKTPIVLLTVLDDAGVRDRGLALGATDIWCKPFGPERLLEKVARLLGPKPHSASL